MEMFQHLKKPSINSSHGLARIQTLMCIFANGELSESLTKKAMELLYERASKLQDLLYEAHQSPQLLLEALETAIQDQPFYVYVDRINAHNCPHAFYQNCSISIQKHTQHLRVTYSAASTSAQTFLASSAQQSLHNSNPISNQNLTQQVHP